MTTKFERSARPTAPKLPYGVNLGRDLACNPSRRRIVWMLATACLVAGCQSDAKPGKPDAKAKAENATPPMPRETRRLPQFADIEEDALGAVCTTADDWTDLFRRYQGWSGADGVYSMPVSGVQAPEGSEQATTLFTFGDTILGEVDPESLQRRKPKMVNFSDALLQGNRPDPEQIEFRYPGGPVPVERFKLAVAPFENWGFWLQDGLIRQRHYYTQAMAIRKLTAEYPWWTRGTVLLKAPMSSTGPVWSEVRQSVAPYKYFEDRDALVYFGVAYLEHTKEAGWPRPDGYVYVYGRYERAMRPFNPWSQRIELAIARVPEESFEDFAAWEYWTGDNWSNKIDDVQPQGLGGPELSVTPMPDGNVLAGKYLLISKHVRTDLYYRVGDSPHGPFGPPHRFYATNEEEKYLYPSYTYNAKAHPHLSTKDALLVSYNVNCPERVFQEGDIYRPRFVWLKFTGGAGDVGAQARR